MSRARGGGRLDDMLRRLVTRVHQLETKGREVVVPVRVAATVTISLADPPTTAYQALVNPTGSTLAWWVQVNPSVGTTTYLQVREEGGALSPIVAAPTGTPSLVSVVLAIPPDWTPGNQRMVFLDSWIDVNTATIQAVRAVVS